MSVVIQPLATPETMVNASSWLTYERLIELLYLDEDEDYTRPTERAFATALKLITQTRYLLAGALPNALLTTTEQGGINFYWRKQEFSVQLTVASTLAGKDYLYIRDQEQSSMHDDVSPSHLADWLRKFMEKSV